MTPEAEALTPLEQWILDKPLAGARPTLAEQRWLGRVLAKDRLVRSTYARWGGYQCESADDAALDFAEALERYALRSGDWPPGVAKSS